MQIISPEKKLQESYSTGKMQEGAKSVNAEISMTAQCSMCEKQQMEDLWIGDEEY